MKFIQEKKKLKSLLSKEIWGLFAHYGAMVAGGAVTSLFTNRDINDIDVYFPSEESLVRTIAAIYGNDDYTDQEIDSFSLVFKGKSQRTLMCEYKGQEVQLMTFKYFANPQEIFDTFDFTVCMGAYDCKNDEFVFHEDFMQHNAQKYLKFNNGTAYPIMSLMRVNKYQDKGYEISKSEYLRVLCACLKLKVSSWEDVKDHCGGMYGYDMSKAFDESKEFSLDELSEQLSTIHERDCKLYVPQQDKNFEFIEVIKSFVNVPPLQQEDPNFDDSKYLYKCVTKEGKSPSAPAGKEITYNVGDIISTYEYGDIYFHASSNNPFMQGDYWVECKVLGEQVEIEYRYLASKKTLKKGTVEVVRRFRYVKDEENNHVKSYLNENYLLPDNN